MRILMAGDTHGNLNHSKYLVDRAKQHGCDAVFVLGDWGYWEHTSDGILFCDKLDGYCKQENMPVYFLDGNHDKTSLLLEKYSDQPDDEGFLLVRPLLRYARRGHRWTWGGIRFISLGGAYSVDKGWRLEREEARKKPESLWFPEEEMSDEDMDEILTFADPVHVMLAHDKPRGSNPLWNRKNFISCLPNQDRLQEAVRTLEPRWFFHGHLHYTYEYPMDYSNLDGEARHCLVRGLTCDPSGGEDVHLANGEIQWYRQRQSWMVVDTDDLLMELL